MDLTPAEVAAWLESPAGEVWARRRFAVPLGSSGVLADVRADHPPRCPCREGHDDWLILTPYEQGLARALSGLVSVS